MSDEKETSYYIFEALFLCYYSKTLITSNEVLNAYGTYVTGDENMDRANRINMINGYLTINQMVEMFKDGVSFSIVNYSDVPIIYKHIENHLYSWKNQLDKGINVGRVPFEDLVLLDKFANKIYDKAKYHFNEEIIQSNGLNALAMLRNKVDIFSKMNEKNILDLTVEELHEKYNKERVSLKTFFEYGSRGFRSWK